MNAISWTQKPLRYVGFGIILALILSIFLDGSNGWGGSEIFTGLALALVFGAILYLKNMEDVSERDIQRRIRTEFPADVQAQVLDIYRRLKTRELEGLFSKILDDANGDENKVKKLASVAESVG